MLQMYIDYCIVNAITIEDCYSLRHIENLHNCMDGSCWFTKFDLAACCYQIHIAIADRQKTAFSTKFVLNEWRVLPFDLANVPSKFMHMTNSIGQPMKPQFIVVCLDDIMIHSCTVA